MNPVGPRGPRRARTAWEMERLRASLLWDDTIILRNLLKNGCLETFDDAMWTAVVNVTRPIGDITN